MEVIFDHSTDSKNAKLCQYTLQKPDNKDLRSALLVQLKVKFNFQTLISNWKSDIRTVEVLEITSDDLVGKRIKAYIWHLYNSFKKSDT